MADVCPRCRQELFRYPDYLYCYSCSRQYKKGFLGRLKEVPNTLQQDQRKAMEGNE